MGRIDRERHWTLRHTLVATATLGLVLAAGCHDGDDDAAPADTADTAEPATTTTSTTSPPAVSRSFPTTVEPAPGLPGYDVYRPTDLGATGEPLPVIAWANGGCVRFNQTWAPLLERWAEAGFVVVAIGTPPEPAAGEPAPSAVSSADDQAKAIDWAEAQDADEESAYAGHLDLDRVVAAGNSCGGITSLALAGSDDRVRSVFVLSGSSVGPGAAREQAAAIMANVSIPVGFAVGGTEDIASSQAAQDLEVQPDGVPGLVANRSTGDHVKVSTDPEILVEAAEIGINWMDLTLYGSDAARQALDSNPCPSCAPDTWTVVAKHLDALTTP